MTDVLISIHPKYAYAILDGIKTVEVRKTAMRKLDPGDTIFLYATAPIKKVVGQCRFVFDWKQRSDCDDLAATCLTRSELYDYLPFPDYGHFLEVSTPIRYGTPKDLSEFGIDRPPQSFCYVPYLEEITHTICWCCLGRGKERCGCPCHKCKGRGSIHIGGFS